MSHPSPATLAKQILDVSDQRQIRGAFPHIVAMSSLSAIEDKEGYELVAAVRRGLCSWRTLAAREIKYHLDILLTHYRVDQWS